MKSIHIYSLLSLLIAFNCSALAATENQYDNFHTYKDTDYQQVYRPKFHFTSKKNWINDPNGMLYYDGEYHLFFQHNPLGTGWGNMAWGHAVSKDMVHWEQLPHAITPYGSGYIFSGTGVVDHNNSLGKQVKNTKTLVLMYSYALDTRPNFGALTPPKETAYYQGIAYSTDRGRTFELLNDGAPIIPFQGRDVDPKGTQRDPKLFWHQESQKWVTLLWLGESSGGKIRVFSSDNLVDWEFETDMTRKWAHECFDLLKLPILNADGSMPDEVQYKWLMYDGSFDYEIGHFDGENFKTEQKVKNHKLGHWNAAQTFNNSPDGRAVIIGWLKNSDFWRYKMPFTEQLSFPATLELRKVGNEILLYRWPVKEISSLYTQSWKLNSAKTLMQANSFLKEISPECFDMTLSISAKENFSLIIRGSILSYNHSKNQLNFISQKNQIKKLDWDKLRPVAQKNRKNWQLRPDQFTFSNVKNTSANIEMRILVDRGSFEIFFNQGQQVLTHSEISDLNNKNIQFKGESSIISSLTIHEIKSSWE